MEATKVPIKGWTDKEYVIYLVEYYLFIKNNVADFPGSSVVKNPSANAGDMGSIQVKLYDFTCVQNLKNRNKHSKVETKVLSTENKHVIVCGDREIGEGG